MTRLIFEEKYDFNDVLIMPKRSSLLSRSEVALDKEYTFLNSGLKYFGIPIISSNMDTVGTFAIAESLMKRNLFTALIKHYSLEELINFYTKNISWAINHTAYSMGMSQDDLDKYNLFKKQAYAKYVMVDLANGYQQALVEFIAKFRHSNPNVVIMVGNVVSPEMTEALLFAGADVIKVGIGSGSACSTRIKAGIGYPQLSAILECADAAHGLGGHIISDGGCSCPGDICKAFAANSDFVMLGGMLAGHEEGGVTEDEYGRVEFYGMSSKKAQEAHSSSLKDYRASEGRVISIPYRGAIDGTIQDILGGLRSCCAYTGSRSLKELPKRTTFVKVHQQFNAAYGMGQL